MTTTNPPAGARPRLALSAVGDLVDAYDADVLAAMQADAAKLAQQGGPAAGAWQSFSTALGEACAIAEYETRNPS